MAQYFSWLKWPIYVGTIWAAGLVIGMNVYGLMYEIISDVYTPRWSNIVFCFIMTISMSIAFGVSLRRSQQ